MSEVPQRTTEQMCAFYVRKCALLMAALTEATNLRDAYEEVMTDAIMQRNRMDGLLKDAHLEIDRLRAEWTMLDDLARADAELPDEG